MRATLILQTADVYRAAYRQCVRRLRDRFSDVREGWSGVMKVLFENEVAVFRQEGATEEDGPWAQLSPGYQAWKESRFPGRPILRLTRKLMAQLTGARGDHYERRMRRKLVFGSNYPVPGTRSDLGGILAEGRDEEDSYVEAKQRTMVMGRFTRVDILRRKRVTYMPERPPIRITEGTITNIVDAILDYAIGTD